MPSIVYSLLILCNFIQNWYNFIAKVNGEKPNTVRQRLKEWYQEAKAKKGKERCSLDVSSCFAPLMQMGCMLTVFVPFETACTLLEKLTGVKLSTATVWNWVQSAGKKACDYLEQELVLLRSGVEPIREVLPSDTESMPLIIGADGVMVPFRQQALTPKGKTVWREIKVS